MYILGINGGFGGGYQDPCACIYSDGKILAAVEEERLIKIKFCTGYFPLHSIYEVLSLTGLSMKDMDLLAFHGISWGVKIEVDIVSYFQHHFGYCPPVKRFHHHDAHAASTYYLSGFDESLVITMDNSGDGISSQVMIGRNKKLELIKRWERPCSFGTFYSCITQLAGFNRDADEYKLMGLAPYGNPEVFNFENFLSYTGNGDYTVNANYLYPIKPGETYPNKQIPLYNKDLLQDLNISLPEIKNIQKDLAASAQQHLENVICEWISYWVKETGMKNICLAGGVAMNCVLNKKILERCGVEKLFVPPFAGDQGVSAGVAFLGGIDQGIFLESKNFTAYTGRQFSIDEIEIVLKRNGISYEITDNPTSEAAQYIAEGKIIGWMQGSSEIGPRALGNRSIIANPAIKEIKDKINKTIKFREDFRPFCPSVLKEDFSIYFNSSMDEIPFMNVTADCTPLTIAELPGIVHADNTARVQTVTTEQNKVFHELLIKVKELTGHGIVLNTSLNVRNQPMAYDVNDAVISFFTSGLDAIFIENILLKK